jgi:hypothetical protein
MEGTLVALWFADIAGYSAHAAKDESGAYAPLSSTRIITTRDPVSKAEISRNRFVFFSKRNPCGRMTTNPFIWKL